MTNKRCFEYKGYTGSIDFSLDDGVLFGKIEFINDLVNYEGASLQELESAFQEEVDDYLDMCKEIGKQPDKSMSGTFNVRVGEQLHKKAGMYALKEGMKINDLMKKALSSYLDKSGNEFHLHIHNEGIIENTKEIEIPSWSKGKSATRSFQSFEVRH